MIPPARAQGAMRRRVITAVAIFMLAGSVISLTAHDPGLTWDEGLYFGFATQYLRWFRHLSEGAFQQDVIRHFWWTGQVHPPLGSLWIALNLTAFGGRLDMIGAARTGAAIVFGLVAAALYLWTASQRGARAGLLAAASFVLMPRIFAHGYFANLEMLTVLFWLLTTAAFERGIASRRWSLACGVFFGLGLLTKFNAIFLPFLLVPWGLLFHGRKAIPNVVAMAVIGPAMFLAGWPALWSMPAEGAWLYLADKFHRLIIPTYYLGAAYQKQFAPWHYPFIMLLATTPVLILAGTAAGAWRHARSLREDWRARSHEALVLINFAFPVLLLALPNAPKYDGVRLMMPAFPFLAVLAADGAGWAIDGLQRRLRPLWRAALAAAAASWLLLPIALFHPYQLAYYGELVGGPWGAHRLGFETTYWMDTLDQKALDYLNAHAPPNGRVTIHGGPDMMLKFYQAVADLRQDIQIVDERWDYAVLIPRQGMLNEEGWKLLRTGRPAWVNGLRPFGTPPVCLVYRSMDDGRMAKEEKPTTKDQRRATKE